MCKFGATILLCLVISGHAFAGGKKKDAHATEEKERKTTEINGRKLTYAGDGRLEPRKYNEKNLEALFSDPTNRGALDTLQSEIANKGFDRSCLTKPAKDGKGEVTYGDAEKEKAQIDAAMAPFKGEGEVAKKIDELRIKVKAWEERKAAADKAATAKAEQAAAGAKPADGSTTPKPTSGSDAPKEVPSDGKAAPAAPAGAPASPAASTNDPAVDAKWLDEKGKEIGALYQALTQAALKAEKGLMDALKAICDPSSIEPMMNALKDVEKLRKEMGQIPSKMPGFAKDGWGAGGNGQPGGTGGAGGQPPGDTGGGTPPSGGGDSGSNSDQNGMGMGGMGMPMNGATPPKSSASNNTPKATDAKPVDIKGMDLTKFLEGQKSSSEDKTLEAIAKAGQPTPATKSSGSTSADDLFKSFQDRAMAIVKNANFVAPATPPAAKRVPSYMVKNSGSRTPTRGVPSSLERTAVKRVK